MKKLWLFFNSQVGLLLLGFLFTSIFGTIITEKIQNSSKERDLLIERARQEAAWERDKKYEIFKRKLDAGESLIDELSNLMNTRFFKMQNIYVSMLNGHMNENRWNDYYKSVEDWNVRMPIIKNKIKRLLSDSLSTILNNYETDDPDLVHPQSIHGMFYITHKELYNYYLHKSENNKQRTDKLNEMLRDLDIETDNYIDVISDSYLRNTLNFENHLLQLAVP